MRIRLFETALFLGLLSVGLFAGPPRAVGSTSYLDEAQRLEAGGQLRAAEIELKNAVRNDQSNMTAHYRLAVVELQLGEAAAAEHEASVARAGGFDPEKVVPLLADAYLLQGKFRALLEQFPAISGSATQRANVLVARGYAQLALQQRDAAKASFEKAQQLAPKATRPILAEAKLALEGHDLAKAGSLYDRALTLAPKSPEALVGKADVLRIQGDAKGALALLDKTLAASPDFVQARLVRAQILLAQRKDQEAETDIQAVMRLQPQNGAAYWLDALVALNKRDFKKANADLQRISGLIAKIPRGYYVQALVQFNLHQLDQAADSAQRFVARNPDDLAGHKLFGLIELALHHPAQTIDALSKFDIAGKADAGTLDLLGRAYAELGLSSRALAAFDQAIKLAPKNAALRLRAGATQLRLGDRSAGVEDLQQSLDLAPSAPAGEMLVLTDLAAAHWQDALATVAKLQKAGPHSPIPGNLLGLVKLAQFDLPGARAQFADLAQKYPKYLPARLNLAHVLSLEGKSDEAANALRQILAQEPANGVVLTRLVNLLLREGKPDAAISAAEQAHSAAPTNVGITVGLIDLYLRLGHKDKALALARQEPGINTVADFPLIAARARAEFAAGHKKEALQTYQRLIMIAPKRLDLRLHYAQAVLAEGDSAGARRAIDEAIKLAPDNARLAAASIAIELKIGGVKAALAKAAELRKSDSNLAPESVLDGAVYMAAHQYDQAAEFYAKAFQQSPSTLLALRLFQARLAGGKDKAAVAGLSKWFAANPNDIAVAEVLGGVALKGHDFDDAKKDFELVLDKSPQDVVALNNLAWLSQKSGDLDGARALAERAYLLSPNLPQAADTLGWILVQQGQAANAIGLLQEANAGLRLDSTIQYHLAVALNDTGHRDQAMALLTPLLKGTSQFDDKSAAEKLFAELSKK
ncbi:MAG TPA: XrtA/PEP-CTERM system TPR-repeat protein PrsT [Stellaceae bacterium]|nr:XrtA/PEP-CTERM system TPR-repeat protein PrsT [Stellaceae bacterium]